ncbi:hypothetical protein [Bacillus toyonensis]
MTVILTREDNTLVPLKNCLAISQNKSTNLFFSSHYDGPITNDVKRVITCYYKSKHWQKRYTNIYSNIYRK